MYLCAYIWWYLYWTEFHSTSVHVTKVPSNQIEAQICIQVAGMDIFKGENVSWSILFQHQQHAELGHDLVFVRYRCRYVCGWVQCLPRSQQPPSWIALVMQHLGMHWGLEQHRINARSYFIIHTIPVALERDWQGLEYYHFGFQIFKQEEKNKGRKWCHDIK